MKKYKFKQQISEIVGNGHPDLIADYISNMVKINSQKSATEVIISQNGIYLAGETSITKDQQKFLTNELKELIRENQELYGKEIKPLKITFDFGKQDEMLSDRREKKLAGDQEVAYYHELNTKDVHYWLKKIQEEMNGKFRYLDYKIAVVMKKKFKRANLSITKSHKNSVEATRMIENRIFEYFGKDTIINRVEFDGGAFFNDTGVTGRKLIVEQAGCGYPHGGGAVYGKDDTKTAPYAHKLMRKLFKGKDMVTVYFPGDDLDKPTYIGEI